MLRADAMILVDYIRNSKYRPNDWEAQFLRDMMFHPPAKLSDKQAVALQNIYAKSTGGGAIEKREYVRAKWR